MKKAQPEWGDFKPQATMDKVAEARKRVAEAKAALVADATSQIAALTAMVELHKSHQKEKPSV